MTINNVAQDIISIHALVKRATATEIADMMIGGISIHALVKRATLTVLVRLTLSVYFNPRPRKEGDGDRTDDETVSLVISIHALVKRATPALIDLLDEVGISIHALVKRATMPEVVFKPCTLDFNPRPRKEGDLTCF